MDSNTVIKVEGLYKKFTRDLKRSMIYGMTDVAKDFIGIKSRFALRKSEFWALNDISFEVKRGERLGLVGANGSGKSTLLRLLTGIFPPDAGEISIKGRVGALIAVGAGFHPHMSGRENIFLNGTIMGMGQKEIARKLDQIIDFAELPDEALEAPVNTYSSGMRVRLGFSVAVHVEPELLFVDEVLAVGDALFQRKCLNRLKDMRRSGITFILVSHNTQTVFSACDKIIFLHKGAVAGIGDPEEIIPQYELSLLKNSEKENEQQQRESALQNYRFDKKLSLLFRYDGHGTNEIDVTDIYLFSEDEIKNEFQHGDSCSLSVHFSSTEWVSRAVIYFSIIAKFSDRREDDIVVLGHQETRGIQKGENVFSYDIGKIALSTGRYGISLSIFDDSMLLPYVQGHYGYFYVKAGKPTLLNAGKGTPSLWI